MAASFFRAASDRSGMGIPQGEHQIAEDAFVTGLHEGDAHAPAIGPTGHQASLRLNSIPDLCLDHLRRTALERRLQPRPVHHRGLLHVANQRLHGVERVPLGVNHKTQVRTAHAEGIDLSIQVAVELGGLAHVAVGADAFDRDGFAQQCDLHGLVALR
jgi:hypothetical protein